MSKQSPLELKPHESKISELIGAGMSIKLLGILGRAVLSEMLRSFQLGFLSFLRNFAPELLAQF